MITITFLKQNGNFVAVESADHATSDESVCVGVSTLMYTIAETITDVLQQKAIIEIDEGGRFYLELENKKENDGVQLLFRTLLTGIKGIVREYPDECALFIKEETC